jgi:hypothetical protein
VRVADSGINGDEPNGEPVEGEGAVEDVSAAEATPEAEASTDADTDSSDAADPQTEE